MNGFAGYVEKPRIKCADCPNRRFLQITDEVIGSHLSGRDDRGLDFVTGVYAMLQDETCFFLAVDFDDENWQQDAAAFLETCRRLEVPAVMERSRSGNGGHVARTPGANAEGEARARSASEAFLFRRLQTLASTTGRFRLNAELPISFDGDGKMEVDLLCAETGVVIELDGAQHLAGAEAYRRDRRKNDMLQQNGYFVLRLPGGRRRQAPRSGSGCYFGRSHSP